MSESTRHPPATDRGHRRWLAAILIGAALIRALYLVEIRPRPDFAHPTVDAEFHDYWARAMVTGDWTPPAGLADPQVRTTPYLRPPGYPWFLAAVYYAGGMSPVVPRLAQFGLGLLNVWLAWWIGRRWFSRTVGLIWAALMGSYWAFVYFEGELHATTLLDTLLLLGFHGVMRWSSEGGQLRHAAAAGACLGLAAIVRPNALLVLAAVAIWMLFSRAWADRRWRAMSAGVMAAVAGLVIAPVTIRNYIVSGEFVLITANGGVNLFIGNHAEADGRCVADLPGAGRFRTCFDYPALVSNLERRTGQEMSHGDVSRWFTQRALEHIRENPGRTLKLLGRKFLLFWGPVEIAHNKEVQCEHDYSAVLSSLPVKFPLALGLALAGAGLLLRRGRGPVIPGAFVDGPRQGAVSAKACGDEAGGEQPETMQGVTSIDVERQAATLALTFMAAWCLSVIPFFVAARYRVQVIPFVLMFAAVAIQYIATAVLAQRWRQAIPVAAAAGVAFLLLRIPIIDVRAEPAWWHFQQGTDYLLADRPDVALTHLEQAIEMAPDNPHARLAISDALNALGRPDEAAAHLIESLTWVHPFHAEVHLELARLYTGARRTDDAVFQYSEAVRLDPGNGDVRIEYAGFLQSIGRTEPSIVEYERALAIEPSNVEANVKLGLLLREAGRHEDAAKYLATAATLDQRAAADLRRMGIGLPHTAAGAAAGTDAGTDTTQPGGGGDDPHKQLAEADRLASVGRYAEAIAAYREFLRDHPQEPLVHYNLGQALSSAGDARGAAAAYAEATRIDPTFAPAWLGLGLATGELGNAAAAVEHYRKAIELDSTLLSAHYNLGMTLGDGLGRYDEAVVALRSALELARRAGREDLVARIDARIERFRAGG